MKGGGLNMTGMVKDVIEKVKDRVLPAPTYRTTMRKFKNLDQFVQALAPGDQVVASPLISGMPSLGIDPGSTHEIESVDRSVLVLKGGQRILAEWFVPEVRRRERLRQRADRKSLIKLASAFSRACWFEFQTRIKDEIKLAEDNVAKAKTEVERAQNRLRQAEETVVRLIKAETDGEVWPRELADKLVGLVDKKLFTNFEQVKEGDYPVLIIYTGPIQVVRDPAKPTVKERGEYALKIYPVKAKTRIVIENVAPGKLPTDVPFNENRLGVCNVCFGNQETELSNLIRDEDWVMALTMIRAFLEGNRIN